MRDRGDREGDDEDAEHDEVAGIAGLGQREIEDRGGREDLDRADGELREHDRQARIDAAARRRSSAASGAAAAEHVERDEGEADDARRRRHRDRQHADEAHWRGRARNTSSRLPTRIMASTKVNQQTATRMPISGPVSPLVRIGAVADDGARQHRAADIVRQRIGGEGAERDEQQRHLLADMGERDVVVAGDRRIGDDGAERRKQRAMRRDGGEPVIDVGEARCRAARDRAATAKRRPRRNRRPARNISSTACRAGCSPTSDSVLEPFPRRRHSRISAGSETIFRPFGHCPAAPVCRERKSRRAGPW